MIGMTVCSGIGAPEVAAPWIDWRWQSEIEAFPCAVLAHRFPNAVNLGDMTNFKEWPDATVDVLVGGTPCQSFSVAGLRKGLDDPRGNLALTYLAIAARYRPRWLVWENVPGVLSALSHEAPDPRPPGIDLDGDDGPGDGTEIVVVDEYTAVESHALWCFVAGAAELGYHGGFITIDAQYVQTPSFARAVPQRRERVFFVGYLGDWRRAAAVLFEPEGLQGHPPPRREAREGTARGAASGVAIRGREGGGTAELTGDVATALRASQGGGDKPHALVAPTIPSRSTGGGGLGTDFDCDGGLIAQPVASTLNAAFGSKQGLEDQHVNAGCPLYVAHTLCGEGFDASADGTGRGTPLVPVAFAHQAGGKQTTLGASDDGTVQTLSAHQTPAIVIQERAVSENPENGPQGKGWQEDHAYTLEARNKVQAVAFTHSGYSNKPAWLTGDRTDAIPASGHHPSSHQGIGVFTPYAVRRLLPVECERLQGFPDGWTAIPYRGKPADQCPDGPRYKALGNSWAVNCGEFIFERIKAVETMSAERMEAAE